MSGSNIIIMPSPYKMIVINMQCNTGVRCNSIQSGVTISGQVITCQVSVSDIKCQVLGVKYNMSSTGVIYQVSGIAWHISSVRYSMASIGVRYQMSSITWQVPVSDIICQI